jgi:hypothetical protein
MDLWASATEKTLRPVETAKRYQTLEDYANDTLSAKHQKTRTQSWSS